VDTRSKEITEKTTKGIATVDPSIKITDAVDDSNDENDEDDDLWA
jgi:hypothetical protein